MSLKLADSHRCDFSLYVGSIFVKMYVTIWEDGNPRALHYEEARFFRWSKYIGRRLGDKITARKMRKKLAGINATIKRLGIDDEISIRKMGE